MNKLDVDSVPVTATPVPPSQVPDDSKSGFFGRKWTKLEMTQLGLFILVPLLCVGASIALPIAGIILPRTHAFNTHLFKILMPTLAGAAGIGLIGLIIVAVMNEIRGSKIFRLTHPEHNLYWKERQKERQSSLHFPIWG